MLGDDDHVLTHPNEWMWTLGLEHDPVEPSAVLLPGRVDPPASRWEGSTAVGQFDSQAAAAAAADALSGICVSETVIVPDQPYPEAPDSEETLKAVIGRLRARGARDAFITDADTGYMHSIDIRGNCESRDQALAIGRQLAPIVWPPWRKGLVKPWAPGRVLTDEQVRARLYVASLQALSDRPPRDALESHIRDLWRAWAAGEENDAGPPGPVLRRFLGEEAEEWGSPWYLHWNVRVENSDICLSSVWCMHFATGFPALVQWLQRSGVRSAAYSVYNLMRP